jgi:phenylacetic acid degradation protein/carnitine operon protein CaiE
LCFGNKFKKGNSCVVCLFQTINCEIQTTEFEQLKEKMVVRQLAIFDKTFLYMIYSFKGFIPVVHPSSFIHPQAAVTGNVIIGKNVYVGPGAAIRGDWGGIIIEDGCNVQENCTIHMFPGVTVLLKEGAHIGHGAVIHGATIGRNCLVGMNSVIMDNVELGDECIVGALSFIKADEKIPARSLLVGNPAKIIKQVSDEMIGWKTAGTRLYQELPGEMMEGWVACEPLSEIPSDRPEQTSLYKTWNQIKGAS